MRRSLIVLGSLFVLSQLGVLAWGAESHLVVQKGRHFNLKEIVIARGDTIAFADEDEFIHQIYVKSGDFNFESAEQSPGETVNVAFTHAGTYEVRCEIHPKMLLIVHVN